MTDRTGFSADAQPLPAAWVDHVQLLLDSFARLLGRELVDRTGSPAAQAARLFTAPCVVVSHDTAPDPLLTYGNRAALTLWEMDVATLLRTPSRLTAESGERGERERLLTRTRRDGFVADYAGVRISATGRRFRIGPAIVWNLADSGGFRGQAATFTDWSPLPD